MKKLELTSARSAWISDRSGPPVGGQVRGLRSSSAERLGVILMFGSAAGSGRMHVVRRQVANGMRAPLRLSGALSSPGVGEDILHRQPLPAQERDRLASEPGVNPPRR